MIKVHVYTYHDAKPHDNGVLIGSLDVLKLGRECRKGLSQSIPRQLIHIQKDHADIR